MWVGSQKKKVTAVAEILKKKNRLTFLKKPGNSVDDLKELNTAEKPVFSVPDIFRKPLN